MGRFGLSLRGEMVRVSGVVRRNSLRVALLALLLGFGVGVPMAGATDTFTLPDTGVDIASAITTVITAMGAIAVVAIGGYFAFLLIKKGLRWGARAIG